MSDNGTQTGSWPPTHVVEVSGPWGSVYWTAERRLYDLLPRGERDELLDMTGTKVIKPYFRDLLAKIMRQCGHVGIDTSSWACDSSLESVEVNCGNAGQLIWSLSEKLWDMIPEDQRPNLLEFIQMVIHEFLELGLAQPLYTLVHNQLR